MRYPAGIRCFATVVRLKCAGWLPHDDCSAGTALQSKIERHDSTNVVAAHSLGADRSSRCRPVGTASAGFRRPPLSRRRGSPVTSTIRQVRGRPRRSRPPSVSYGQRTAPTCGAGDCCRHRGEPVILCGPGDYRVGGQGQAPRLLGLILELAGADHALVRVQQVPAQSVEGFALVELAGDLAPVVRVRQVAGRRRCGAGPRTPRARWRGVLASAISTTLSPAARGVLSDRAVGR